MVCDTNIIVRLPNLSINEPANRPTMGNAKNWKNVRRTTLTGEFVSKNTTQPETRTYAKCVKDHSIFPKISRWKCLSRTIEENRCSHIFTTSIFNDLIVNCPFILLRVFTSTRTLLSAIVLQLSLLLHSLHNIIWMKQKTASLC